MKSFSKQLIFIAVGILIITSGVLVAVAVNNRGGGPVAWYKMDEGYGSTTADYSNNNNTATIAGGYWKNEPDCKTGKCLYFDGSDDYVSVNDADILTSASMSISVWVKGGAANKVILYKGSTSSNREYAILTNISGSLSARFFDANDATYNSPTSVATFDTTNWHHIVGTFDDSTDTGKLYIDGVLVATDSTAITITNQSSALNIGRYGGGSLYFPGLIDDVRIYNYVRSASQIKADYVKSAGGKGATVKVASLQEQQAASEGLVGYWKMDEASWNGTAGEVIDSSGNGNNGTSTNGANTTSTAKFGMAGSFDGTDDYVNAGSGASLNITNAITISAWVKTPSVSTQQAIVSRGYYTKRRYQFDITSSKARFGLANGDYIETQDLLSGNTTLQSNIWYYLTAVFNGSYMYVYVNGVLDGSLAKSTKPSSSTAEIVYVGVSLNNSASDFYRYFNGQIDDVKIYNKARTAEQIRRDYESGPSPVAHWRLDENQGQYAYDTSGNGNTGTLGAAATAGTDDPTWASGKYGSALNFDGSNDYVDVGNGSGLNFGDGSNDLPFSISAWVKATDWTSNTIFCKYTDTSHRQYYFVSGGTDRIFLVLYDQSANAYISRYYNTSLTSYENKWIYLIATYDGSKSVSGIKIYLNGVRVDDTNYTGGSYTAMENLSINAWIGKSENGVTLFHGLIDDVKIYNYARTPKQILEDMNAGHPAVGSPVGSYVAYWPLDEMQGTTAYDKSINQNNLSLSTATWATTTPCQFAGCWQGLGASWLTRADDDDFDFATSDDFTISLWVKSNSSTPPSTAEYLLRKANSTAGYGVFFATTTGYLTFGVDDDTTWNPDASVSTVKSFYDNKWHHIVAIKNGTTSIEIYLDGVQQASSTSNLVSLATLANSSTLVIGDSTGSDTGDEFNGLIDEVKIYRFALSPAEIKEEYDKASSLKLGSFGGSQGPSFSGATSSDSSWLSYCIPGDTATCTPPVGHWKMDEMNGQYAYDISGKGNTGTLGASASAGTDDPTWKVSGCKSGSCLSFDGTDDYVSGSGTNFPSGASARTICAWAKISSATYQGIVGYGAYVNGRLFYISKHGTNWWLRGEDSAYDLNTNVAADTNWNFHCGIYDGITMYYYLNGVLIGSKNTTLNTTATGFRVGRYANDSYYVNGLIDDVRIYNYARTPAQIAWDYNRGAPVAHWKMDDGIVGGTNLDLNATYYAQAANNTVHDITDQDISISAWVKVDTDASLQGVILAKRIYGQIGYIFSIGTGAASSWKTAFYMKDAGLDDYTVTGNTNINDNKWHHVVIIIDRDTAANCKVYLDGVDNTATRSGTLANVDSITNSYTLGLGGYANNTYQLDGQVRDVKLYYAAGDHWTDAQVLYQATHPYDYTANAGRMTEYWKLDEGKSTTLYGSAGNNLTLTSASAWSDETACDGTISTVADNSYACKNGGTCNNGVLSLSGSPATSTAWSEGKYGCGLTFDGTDDYVSVSDSVALSSTSSLTISAWVKTSTSQSMKGVVTRGVSGSDYDAMLYLSGGASPSANFYIKDSAGTGDNIGSYAFNYVDNSWHHYVVLFDGDWMYLYIDGIMRISKNTSLTNIRDSSNPLRIGSGYGYYFNGLIDDVQIYNYALTATQVKTLFNEGAAVRFGPSQGLP